MKNYRLSSICVLLIATVLCCFCDSCKNRNVTELSNDKLVPIVSQQKTENQYIMFCNMGHDGANCKGCVTINGITTHVNCQGAGTACQKASSVSLFNIGSSLYATTLDTFGFTTLDILNMPSRSFSLETEPGVYTYLNIPAQLVYRDTSTMQFTFTGLSFTNRPLY